MTPEDKKSALEGALNRSISFYRILAWVCILLGLAVAAFGFIVFQFFGEDNSLAKYGDYSGGTVTALWSLAGLFIIYVAFLGQKLQLVYQQYELELNRLELSQTREELKNQRDQMTKQTEVLEAQFQDNRFYTLLKNHTSIFSSMTFDQNELSHGEYTVTGRACFREIYFDLFQEHQNRKHNMDPGRALRDSWDTVYHKFAWFLNPYFTSIGQLIRVADSSPSRTQETFFHIIRSSITGYEAVIFHYYDMLQNNEFNELILRHRLLTNLPAGKTLG